MTSSIVSAEEPFLPVEDDTTVTHQTTTMTTTKLTTVIQKIVTQHRSLILLGITTFFLFSSHTQNLIAPNLTEIGNEFGFDTKMERDKKIGGYISIAYFSMGAPASYIVGCFLVDSSSKSNYFYDSRISLFVFMVFLGQGACAATYFFGKTYRGLLVTSALMGISFCGVSPIVHSLQGDLYSSDQRGLTYAIYAIGCGFGTSFGQVCIICNRSHMIF